MTANMKTSELRLGNLVLNSWGENSVEVTIDILMSLESMGSDSKYKPIPLTEEWLFKFGFEINRQTKKENNIWRCYSEEGFFEVEQIGEGFFLDDNDCYGTELNYVHQLQNLYFALTGEELTFKSE